MALALGQVGVDAGIQRDRRGGVLHRAGHKAVAGGIAAVVAALHQQRVAARFLQGVGAQVSAGTGVVHGGGAEHHRAARVQQAPVHIAAAAGGDVEKPALAGGGVELVGVGLVGRAQRAADGVTVVDGRGAAQVLELEAVVAEDLVGTEHGEAVVTRHQVHHRQAVGRIAGAERPVGRDVATRPAQRPAQVVAVAAVVGAGGLQVLRAQGVEVDPRIAGQAEGVGVGLALGDGGVDGAVQRQRGAAVVDPAGHEAVGGGSSLVVTPLDQQRVVAGLGQRDSAHVVAGRAVHVGRAEHGRAVGVDQPPVHVAAAAGGDVEVPAFIGRAGAELVGVGAVGRAQRAADGGAGHDGRGGRQVDQPEAVGAADGGGSLHGEGVGARGQRDDAIAFGRIALAEGAVGGDHRAIRAGDRPAQVVAVAAGAGEELCCQRVEADEPGLSQRESVPVDLARRAQRGADDVTQHQRGQHLGCAGDDSDRDVVEVVVGEVAAVARAEGQAAVVGRHAADEVVGDDGSFDAAAGREVDRDIAAAAGRRHHDASVVEGSAVQAEARGHQCVQVELCELGAVEVQRDMVVADLAVVDRVEADAQAASHVHFFAKLRRRAAGAPDTTVEPGKADAVATRVCVHLGDAQVELGADRARVDAGRGIGKADRVGASHRARQQPQEVAAGPTAELGWRACRRQPEAGRCVGQAQVVEVLRGEGARVGLCQAVDLEAVVDRRALAGPAFEHQHVAPGDRHHGGAVGEGGRAHDHAAIGPDQAPARAGAAGADLVEADQVTRGGVEAVEISLAARIQRAGDRGAQRDRRGVGAWRQVHQPEGISADGVAVGVYRQRVIAGGQRQRRVAGEVE